MTAAVPETAAGRPPREGLVSGVALLAYSVAVFHRASFGVAGVETQHRRPPAPP